MKHRRSAFTVLVMQCCAVGLFQPMVQAQGENKETHPVLDGEVIDVRVINVEAVVTDSRGQRVEGLAREDFELRIDGEEVSIDYFSEVREGRALAEVGAVSSGDAEPARSPSKAGEAVGARILVFIDDVAVTRHWRDAALARMDDQLAALSTSDRLAVVAFDGNELTVLCDWTGSRETMHLALTAAKARPAFGIFNRFSVLNGAPRGAERRARAAFELERLGGIDEALVRTLRGFANAVGGRKSLVLIMGPLNPGPVVTSLSSQSSLAQRVVGLANLLGYSVYPIDVERRRTQPFDAEREGAPPEFVDELASQLIFPFRDRVRERDRVSQMRALAAATGGRWLVDRHAALAAVVADARAYYWLGFEPTRQHDGATHRLEVRARGRNLVVRSRTSFRDRTREEELEMATEGSLLVSARVAPAELEVSTGRPEPRNRRRMVVPLRIGVPADSVTMLNVDGRSQADLELRIAVQDHRGHQADLLTVPLQLSVDVAPLTGTLLHHETELLLRQRPHHLVVTVYDRLGDRLLSGRADIALPGAADR